MIMHNKQLIFILHYCNVIFFLLIVEQSLLTLIFLGYKEF